MYSYAHLDVAHKLYPEKVEDVNWLRRQWTDGGINRCKDYETKKFQLNPTYKEWQGCFLDGSMMKEDPIHNWYKGHLIRHCFRK